MNPFTILTAFRRLDRLFELETKHGKLIEAQAERIQSLQDPLTRLAAQVEAREQIVVAEAKGAAGAAASAVASQNIADMSRRLGSIEERVRANPPRSIRQDRQSITRSVVTP